jgi:hypothetical protein
MDPLRCSRRKADDIMDMLAATPFPREIRLENTNACNARCVICPREKQTRSIGIISPELVEQIVDEAKSRPIDKFTVQGFGEPLFDKNFCNHLRRIKGELGCPTFSVSNGSLITPELAEDLVTCGLDKIKISFYGINKREYESVHHGLTYERTVAGVTNLIRAKRAARSKMIIRVQYIGRLWRFLPFVLQWAGKAAVGYSTLHNYGGARRYQKIRQHGGKCPIVSEPIIQVLWDGRVAACCYDFDGTMILGDLRHQTMAEIWHGEPYQRLRRAQVTGDFAEWPLCRNCDRRLRPLVKLNPRVIGRSAPAPEPGPAQPLGVFPVHELGDRCPAGAACSKPVGCR